MRAFNWYRNKQFWMNLKGHYPLPCAMCRFKHTRKVWIKKQQRQKCSSLHASTHSRTTASKFLRHHCLPVFFLANAVHNIRLSCRQNHYRSYINLLVCDHFQLATACDFRLHYAAYALPSWLFLSMCICAKKS